MLVDSIIEQVYLDQKEQFKQQSIHKIVNRGKDIKTLHKTPFIVVVAGVRRCGKSTLLSEISREVGECSYLNFDDERLLDFDVQNFDSLLTIFRKHSKAKTILFDEIQNVDYWERFVRRLYDEGYKLYITGSNSNMLSSELGTHLTGRYIKIELFPFSFREFLDLRELPVKRETTAQKADVLAAFDTYLFLGGFPDHIKYQNENFLQMVYSDIVHRDIISRYGIRKEKQFKQLSYYLFSNFTCDTSYNSIKNILNVKSTNTVSENIGYLENAFLVFELYKYDYSLKKQHIHTKKIYVIDNGLRNMVSFQFSTDKSKHLENLVYLHLRRTWSELYFHREKNECDFIVREKNVIVNSIQVCYELNPQNRKREIAGLTEAMERYKLSQGLLITYNQSDVIALDNSKKIMVIPAWQWILGAP